MRGIFPVICLLATLLGDAFVPVAAEANVEFRAGATHSDNIRRENVDEIEETFAIAGLSVFLSGEMPRFEGGLDADFEYRDYLDDVFDDETIPDGLLEMTFKAAPDVIHWYVKDRIGVTQNDPFGVATPDNREIINVLETGPDFFARLGSRTSIELQGRYRDTTFETADSDNSALSGTVSLVRRISTNRSISLNASTESVEFDNTDLNSDFNRRSAYLELDSEVSKGNLSVAVGLNELEIEGEDFDGTLAAISFDRALSTYGSFSLSYDRRFSDAGDFFSRFGSIGSPGLRSRDTVPVGDPFVGETASIGYVYDDRRVGFSLSAFAGNDDYRSESSFDSERIGGSASVKFSFRSGWDIAASASIERRDFTSIVREDEDLDVRVSISRRLTQLFSVSMEFQHEDRSSNTDAQDYRENRISLTIRFHPTG